MATNFSNAKRGIPVAETGIILESIQFTFKSEKQKYSDLSGNTVGIDFFDQTCDVSVSGLVPKTSAFDGDIMASWTLANSIPSHGVSGGTLILETVDYKMGVGDYTKIDLKGTIYPYVTGA